MNYAAPDLTALGTRLGLFSGGDTGPFRVISIMPAIGPTLPAAARMTLQRGATTPPAGAAWSLAGVNSNVRYVEQAERAELRARHADLGRLEATYAALIPISKSPEWWQLTQDERRHIFEAQSHHIAASIKYLPAIARQLFHSRDLGQPFDFLTWFEYAPEDADAFEELVTMLRRTEEWKYVTAEVDVRLVRD